MPSLKGPLFCAESLAIHSKAPYQQSGRWGWSRGGGPLLHGCPYACIVIHSSKLTWKCRGAPLKTTMLYIGPSMSFNVNLGEGRLMVCTLLVIYPLTSGPEVSPRVCYFVWLKERSKSVQVLFNVRFNGTEATMVLTLTTLKQRAVSLRV